MKRRRKENNHETSPSPPTQRCREISTGEKSDDNISIPLDLTVEILKKLPAKTLMRFRCVSKQWSSIIDSRRDFIDSIVTRPPPRDTHLIFYHHTINPPEWSSFFFCSTYPQNLKKDYRQKVSKIATPGGLFEYVRGLILCWRKYPWAAAVYNPTTRQSLLLPGMETMHPHFGNCLFGYDPLDNEYKVLCIRHYDEKQLVQVFTLGDHTKKWRNIQCNLRLHIPMFDTVCINGTIYYKTTTRKRYGPTYTLMSFDVRSEEFDLVEAPKTMMNSGSTLINYRGKLGLLSCCEKGVEIWVMKYIKKKQEWSKFIFYEMEGFEKWRMGGVTGGGEIVFIKRFKRKVRRYKILFDVFFYYDPQRNSLRRGSMVESIRNSHIEAVPDHVENTMRL